jgi:hypothetical protein
MNKYLFLSLLSILLLSSCNRRGDRIEIPFTAWVEIPAGLNSFYTHHFPVRVPTFGSVPLGLTDAQPANIRLFLENGAPTFDFARSIFLDAVTDTSRNEIGFHVEMPVNNSSTADLFPSIVNLKDHISQDSFDIELKVQVRGVTNASSRVRIEFSMLCEVED